jgi:hypothetical protein
VRQQPGIGVEVDKQALERVTTRRSLLTGSPA